MPLAEVLAIQVGSSIAKSIIKIWLKDATLAQDTSLSLVDILKSRISNTFDLRRAQHQFEAIGERVGESLLPIFEAEEGHLDVGGSTAVALAVAETFNRSKISNKLLLDRDLDPKKLADYLKNINSTATKLFSSAETALYYRIIDESCECIIDIASEIPAFTERAFAEVLKRGDELLAVTEQILQIIQRTREQQNPMEKASQFESKYRRAVIRNLDILELFGTNISAASRRHCLSVAYVTLTVEQQESSTLDKAHKIKNMGSSGIERSPYEIDRNYITVNEALTSSKCLLVRGLAGSGKTTLLKWIAVRSASRSFEGELLGWNDTLPFFIRLRRFAKLELPPPENFLKQVAPSIAGIMPEGWAHTQLESGRAIVLIDGLDEVPELQRDDVLKWLKELVETFPKARFVITARPHAVTEGWIDYKVFKDAELQPMELPSINIFIDHWHNAIERELQEEAEKIKLPHLAKNLKNAIRQSHPLCNLATNPLLCAMLCALHRDKQKQLPEDRIELYEDCCQLLIEQRDKVRQIGLTDDYPNITYRQKRVLLEDLAYWMLKNGWSELDLSDVDNRFTKKLTTMQKIPSNVTGEDIRRLFIERSGIVREPTTDIIDFTHRTFQEFLAAHAILDEGDIGLLVQNAHIDQWHEVIILATGCATKKVREDLLEQLILRGDQEKKLRYQLHLLAVSCLAVSVDLNPSLRTEVEKRLGLLVPPKNLTDAKALASAGNLAVPHLKFKPHALAATLATCVRTLALISGDMALEQLEGYVHMEYSSVADELCRAWKAFNKETYAKRIISRMSLAHISSLDDIQYFSSMNQLELVNFKSNELNPLANLNQMVKLTLRRCGQVTDLSVLANLTKLELLYLSDCEQITNLSPLSSLNQLKEFLLTGCEQIMNLNPLSSLTQLTTLFIAECNQIIDLNPLSSLTQLKRLHLMNLDQIVDLSPLANLTQLETLDLAMNKQVIDLSPLANFTQLRQLDLRYSTNITNISALKGLKNLKILR